MKKKILSAAVLGIAAVALTGCDKNNDQPTSDDLSRNVKINMSLCYKNLTPTNNQDSFKGPDGKTYVKGELLPVFQQLESDMNIDLVDVTESGDKSAAEKFEAALSRNFMSNGNQIHLINSSVTKIYEAGEAGNLVDLAQYLDHMPNFKAWLEENPAYEKMLKNADGQIYTTPYFDGEEEIEKMYLMNNDFVKKILDAETFTGSTTNKAKDAKYTAWKPEDTAKDVEMKVARLVDGKPTAVSITKKYSAFENGKNIITAQNELISAGKATGAELANQFRQYINAVYDGCGYTSKSDVFIGVDASYDANELIALMRVVRANSQELAGVTPENMIVMASREGKTNRLPDILRFAQIWGFRGLESRQGYLYFDANGELQDARGDKYDSNGKVVGSSINDALDLLNQLYNEGLIVENVDDGSSKWRQIGVTEGRYFVGYDYNQSSTVYDKTTLGDKSKTESFTAVLPPMVNWNDGDDSTFMYQFSESTRSMKSDGWCIPKAVENDKAALYRSLTIMDYFYSEEGNNLINFGPEAWRDGTITYKGQEYVKLSQYSLDGIAAEGNWTNWMRKYVGATLPVGHIRPMALEYQILSESGKKGIENLNNAYLAGTFVWASNSGEEGFKKLAPAIISIPAEFTDQITTNCKTYMDFYDTSKAVFISAVTKGFGADGVKTKEELNSQAQKFYDYYVQYYRKGYKGELA